MLLSALNFDLKKNEKFINDICMGIVLNGGHRSNIGEG